MARHILDLMRVAAELRAAGLGWKAVGEKVHRKTSTVQQWPSRYREWWIELYRDAQVRRFDETANEAFQVHRTLLHADNDRTQLRAVEVWLKCAAAAFGRTGTMIEPVYSAKFVSSTNERAAFEKACKILAAERDATNTPIPEIPSVAHREPEIEDERTYDLPRADPNQPRIDPEFDVAIIQEMIKNRPPDTTVGEAFLAAGGVAYTKPELLNAPATRANILAAITWGILLAAGFLTMNAWGPNEDFVHRAAEVGRSQARPDRADDSIQWNSKDEICNHPTSELSDFLLRDLCGECSEPGEVRSASSNLRLAANTFEYDLSPTRNLRVRRESGPPLDRWDAYRDRGSSRILSVAGAFPPGAGRVSHPIRVAFVGDSPDDVRVLVEQLRQGGFVPTYERVETADGLRSALHRGGWDVLIADYCMPRFSGLEALAITLQLAPEVPFLIVSGTVGEEVAVESIRAGAADYLMRENLIRFVPAVTRAIRDAAERRAMRRAESLLRQQRSLLGLIFDNTSDALMLFSWMPAGAEWIVSSINRACLDLAAALGTHLSEADVVGKTFDSLAWHLLPRWTDEAADVIEDLSRVAESGKPIVREVRFTGDRVLYLDLTTIPFHGPDGQSRHVLTVARDISARKRAEADRRDFESRLMQARKMEALGQLAGGVAHDFNNILAGILGYAEVIQKTAKDPNAAGFSGEIVQAAKRARDLIRQILMFSRRQPGERKPVQLSGIVREALHLIQGTIPAAVQVEIRSPNDEPFLLGDPTQLHQAVLNLATNAVQAMGDAGGRLDVTVEVLPVSAEFARRYPPLRDGEHVKLTVADTGPGIPEAALGRLFEPFFTTKPPGVGTGLGLSVVHGVVQNHEGAIVVHSRDGDGARFDLYFPAVRSPSWTGDSKMLEGLSPTAGRRILFVDDEPSIVRLAQVMLKNLGHTVSAFEQPAQALAALKAGPTTFDLAITDLTMPGMSGTEFAAAVRGVRADLPIILSSGYPDEVSEERMRELGIVEVLPKPFQMSALAAAVNRAGGLAG